MSTKLLRIREKIQKRGLSLRSAIEVVTRVHLTSTDYSFMCSFIKTSDEWFSLHGRELKLHVKSQIEYYKSVQGCPAKEDVCKLSGGNVPSNDKFSAQFISIYHENDNDIKNNLVTLLLRALVTKMSGQKNARYDDKVRNFFIALADINR